MKKTLKIALVAAVAVASLISCKQNPKEPEVIPFNYQTLCDAFKSYVAVDEEMQIEDPEYLFYDIDSDGCDEIIARAGGFYVVFTAKDGNFKPVVSSFGEFEELGINRDHELAKIVHSGRSEKLYDKWTFTIKDSRLASYIYEKAEFSDDDDEDSEVVVSYVQGVYEGDDVTTFEDSEIFDEPSDIREIFCDMEGWKKD